MFHLEKGERMKKGDKAKTTRKYRDNSIRTSKWSFSHSGKRVQVRHGVLVVSDHPSSNYTKVIPLTSKPSISNMGRNNILVTKGRAKKDTFAAPWIEIRRRFAVEETGFKPYKEKPLRLTKDKKERLKKDVSNSKITRDLRKNDDRIKKKLTKNGKNKGKP